MRISHIKMATSTCIEDVMVIQKLCVNDHSKYAALILCTNMDKCINNLRDVALSGRLPCCILDATMVRLYELLFNNKYNYYVGI